MNLVGKKIRMLRYQRAWTQEEVAARLGLSVPAFSKIETGVSDISLSRLEQIAALFDLSVIALLMLDEQGNQKTDSEIANLDRLLNKRDGELINLQKQVIELYEELRISSAIS